MTSTNNTAQWTQENLAHLTYLISKRNAPNLTAEQHDEIIAEQQAFIAEVEAAEAATARWACTQWEKD
jgi:hypothetical protein